MDLIESDHSSPRTPNLVLIEPSNPSSNSANNKQASTAPVLKERSPANVPSTSLPPSNCSKVQTVYKTVDFIKTEALNKLRHTLDQGNI